MKLPTFLSSPAGMRFLAAGAIFLAWFVILIVEHSTANTKPVLDPTQFVTIDKYVLIGLLGYHTADKTPEADALLMRLLAGIGLLGMWVALVVVTIVPPGELVDAMAVGLFMLGVLPSSKPADLALPSLPQAGHARLRFLALLGSLSFAGVAFLQGCMGTAALSPIQQASALCTSYGTVQSVTESLKQAGKLTPAQLAKYKAADAAAVKACNAPPPTTAASEATWAANVTTQMTILSTINQGAK